MSKVTITLEDAGPGVTILTEYATSYDPASQAHTAAGLMLALMDQMGDRTAPQQVFGDIANLPGAEVGATAAAWVANALGTRDLNGPNPYNKLLNTDQSAQDLEMVKRGVH